MASPNGHPLPSPPGQGQESYFQNVPPQQQQQQPQQRYPQQYQKQQQQHPQYQSHQSQYAQPGQQQKPRPRSRGFSFRSDKSHKSSGSKDHKVDLHETHNEKESRRLHSKADPSVAMNEAEPATVQASAKTSLAPLRGIQHKDPLGNPIADPDRSNPTRSRWERPLDTIRSFEAAIDGGYNRKSYLRSGGTKPPVPLEQLENQRWGTLADQNDIDSESVVNVNPRRNSYYGTNSGPNGGGGRFPHESYYGGRPQSTIRMDEQAPYYPRNSGGQRDSSYFNEGPQGGGYYNGYSQPAGPNNPARQRYPRTASEPQFNSYRQQADPSVYPIPNNHRSYETVASASGSGTSGEQGGYQTDLTSDNSSAERVQAVQRQKTQSTNDYGIGFSQNTAPTSFNVGINPGPNVNTNSPLSNGNGYHPGGGHSYGPPPVPTKETGKGSLLRKTTNQSVEKQDKRKSWFGRRFSKNS